MTKKGTKKQTNKFELVVRVLDFKCPGLAKVRQQVGRLPPTPADVPSHDAHYKTEYGETPKETFMSQMGDNHTITILREAFQKYKAKRELEETAEARGMALLQNMLFQFTTMFHVGGLGSKERKLRLPAVCTQYTQGREIN